MDEPPRREPIFVYGGAARLIFWLVLLGLGIVLTSTLYPFFYGLITGRP